jgi:uncharacterized small protein (DUF1192 family)
MLAQAGLPGKMAGLNSWQHIWWECRAMEEEDRKRPSSHEVGMVLDVLSVEELQDRIALLEGEIARIKQAIAAKSDSRRAAEAAFKI